MSGLNANRKPLPGSTDAFSSQDDRRRQRQRLLQGSFINIVIFILALLSSVLAATFFLIPYYSVTGHYATYDGPVPVRLPRGRYRSEMKSTTALPSAGNLPLAIRAGMWLVDERVNTTDITECPAGFHMSSHFPSYQAGGREVMQRKCVNLYENMIKFIEFTPPKDETLDTYTGPKERSLQVDEFIYRLDEAPADFIAQESRKRHVGTHVPPSWSLEFVVEMLRFEEKDGGVPCKVDSDCDAYTSAIFSADTSTSAYVYERGSGGCYRELLERVEMEENLVSRTGCAVALHLGTSDECFGGTPFDFLRMGVSSDTVCSFMMHYAVYIEPPQSFTQAQMWSWGVIGFVSIYFLYLFMVIWRGTRLYKEYVSCYYFKKNLMKLEEGWRYEFALLVTGEPFSRRKGCFRVSVDDHVVFDYPLRAVFGEEDIEGSGTHTLKFRGSFVAQAEYENVSVDVDWLGGFQMAHFREPSVRVIFRRALPYGINSKLNLLYTPLYYRYLYVVAFLAAAQTSVLICFVFAISAYFEVFGGMWIVSASEYPWIWGTAIERPVIPLPVYALFSLFLYLPPLLGLMPFWSTVEQGIYDNMDTGFPLNAGAETDSAGQLRSWSMGSGASGVGSVAGGEILSTPHTLRSGWQRSRSSTLGSTLSEGMSHLAVEYTAMSSFKKKGGNGAMSVPEDAGEDGSEHSAGVE